MLAAIIAIATFFALLGGAAWMLACSIGRVGNHPGPLEWGDTPEWWTATGENSGGKGDGPQPSGTHSDGISHRDGTVTL